MLHGCTYMYAHICARGGQSWIFSVSFLETKSLTDLEAVFPKPGLQHRKPCLALTCRGFELSSPDLLVF